MIGSNSVRIKFLATRTIFLDMANGRSNHYSGIAANSEMMKTLA